MSATHPFDNMTDEEVVLIAQQGSDEAFDYIIRKFKPQVIAKSSPYFIAGADKDDLTQEGLIGLFKAIQAYRPDKDASFRSFADLCVTRRVISAVKGASRLKHFPLNSSVSLDKQMKDENGDSTLLNIVAADSSSNPEHIVLHRENLAQVEDRVNEALSAFEYRVLSLSLEGKSYGEIAFILGKDPKSIDNALQRIKKKCEKLADSFD